MRAVTAHWSSAGVDSDALHPSSPSWLPSTRKSGTECATDSNHVRASRVRATTEASDTGVGGAQSVDPDATPVLYVAVNARAPMREITEVADKVVRRRIENAPGVGQVTVVGGSKRQVNVILDPTRLRAFGLTAVDVERGIRAANLTLPGGRLEEGPTQRVLRVRGRVESAAEVANLSVAERDGAIATVGITDHALVSRLIAIEAALEAVDRRADRLDLFGAVLAASLVLDRLKPRAAALRAVN